MKFIIRSKKIYDGISKGPVSGSILVEGKKIAAVLPYDIPDEYAEIPVEDFGEKLVMPSFMDAHTHIFSGAIAASEYVCDTLGQCHSKEECAEMIGQYAKDHPQQKRIRGTGWFLGVWEDDTLPDKSVLDAVIPDIPVYLQNADGHSFWLNSAAIKESGVVPIPDLPNGIVVTDENGELTGILIEPAACEPAMEKYMDFSRAEREAINSNLQKILAKKGIAAMSEMFAEDYTPENYDTYGMLKDLDEAGGMNSQVFIYTKLFGYTDFEPWRKMREHFNSEHVHIAGVKGFVDGVTETYTGLLLEPYTDKPETCGDNLPLWPQEKMQEEIIAANKEGIQVRLHCIGDGAVRMALDMYENSGKANPGMSVMNTIEHIENIHPSDINRFAELGVIPSMQPYHVTLSNCDKVDRLGEERCEYEWPIRSIYDTGAALAIGTDFPVVTLDPFETIYAANTRLDQKGKPMCRNVEAQKLPMDVILNAYTMGAARVYGVMDKMGSIEAGKDADIIVLSKNLFEIEPVEILDTEVLVNFFEGRTVYEK